MAEASNTPDLLFIVEASFIHVKSACTGFSCCHHLDLHRQWENYKKEMILKLWHATNIIPATISTIDLFRVWILLLPYTYSSSLSVVLVYFPRYTINNRKYWGTSVFVTFFWFQRDSSPLVTGLHFPEPQWNVSKRRPLKIGKSVV